MRTLTAFLLYLAITFAMTWPLAVGMNRDVPGDLGDSLLNMWILGWGAENVPRVATGQLSFGRAWDANIFHPEPLALSFSEHLFGQVLQILPIYHLTGNLILCYNLLFLSTFVLSGLAMYLLVRDVTGNSHAAFVAGLLFAFVPFRIAQVAHIQTLSSQWMPLALYGFRRYVSTSSVVALAGGSAALLMQNWSCGYFLMFFAPLVLMFVVHQIVAAGRTRELKVWLMFAAAAAIVALGTWPFLAMYLQAQRVHRLERPIAEIIGFSADVYSYFTAPEALRLLGSTLRPWPKPEGALFLGFVPALLAGVGVIAALQQARASAAGSSSLFKVVARARRISMRALLVAVIGLVAVALLGGVALLVFTGGFVTNVAGVPIRATNALRLGGQLAIATAALIALSGKFRRVAAHVIASPTGIAAISLALAVWLSLGPLPRARGQVIPGFGLYALLLDHLPGFSGLRVPARYAMVAAVYLSVLAGIGAAVLMRPRPRSRTSLTIAAVLSVAFLTEAAFAPLLVNQTWGEGNAVPPARVEPKANAPAVYRQLASMPAELVLAEFPFGDPAWELRYVYYSTVHWKRIVNGYSGGFPQGYKVRVARLQRIDESPDDAWQTLVQARTTHVVVHESAMRTDDAALIHGWLRSRGAREIGRFGSDVLYDLTHAR
jgi:hypothetical protein